MPTDTDVNLSEAHAKLSTWLNKSLKVTISDGRILIGVFLCVDRDINLIIGNCNEYLSEDEMKQAVDARYLGLAMIPGKHIVQICEDTNGTVGSRNAAPEWKISNPTGI
ncbi:N-alpha-acetyltransferase 38, NatC auxiliary subunit isoform X2 [Galendromus occidentalis]|uniref:N-alpha-acetyltransferase 38, NatC auxiliary subunit isoform X2 n=1 Tax=Galendromus occidentalis TaxID=34638 RepID=A0AAJ6W087_9ACAR|nr:N-alpha-acetyltransferase 38, NatC auxiliary subunit isoform X2 [Galendromus occidentalis]